MNYSRYLDRRTPTWSLVTGTARTGYPVTALGDLDPSTPLWINETTLRAVADLGSAFEVQAVFLFNHTFEEACAVRVQANATNVWTSPTLNQVITIEAPYRDGYACHAAIDLTVPLPSAGARTFRYWSVTNAGDANAVSVAIGEIWLAGTWRPLTPYDIQHDYQRPQEHLVSRQASKRGVQTVYDAGSRQRELVARCHAFAAAQLDILLDWIDEQHGSARPMVMVLDPDGESRRDREPHLCRLQNPRLQPTSIMHNTASDVDIVFEELGSGEPIAAT